MRTAILLCVTMAFLTGCDGSQINSPVLGKWQGEYKQHSFDRNDNTLSDRSIILELKSDGTFTDTGREGQVSSGKYSLIFSSGQGTLLLQYASISHNFDITLEGDRLHFRNDRLVAEGKPVVSQSMRILDHTLTRVK